MTTISDGTTTITPLLVTGYESTRQSRNVIHDIIGREDPEVTLRVAGLRTGTLEMLVSTLANALALEALHTPGVVMTLADVDLPGLNMDYVTSGDIGVQLDDETRDRWLVTVDYQEVAS